MTTSYVSAAPMVGWDGEEILFWCTRGRVVETCWRRRQVSRASLVIYHSGPCVLICSRPRPPKGLMGSGTGTASAAGAAMPELYPTTVRQRHPLFSLYCTHLAQSRSAVRLVSALYPRTTTASFHLLTNSVRLSTLIGENHGAWHTFALTGQASALREAHCTRISGMPSTITPL